MENALLMLGGIAVVVWIIVGLDWRARRKDRRARDRAAQPATIRKRADYFDEWTASGNGAGREVAAVTRRAPTNRRAQYAAS